MLRKILTLTRHRIGAVFHLGLLIFHSYLPDSLFLQLVSIRLHPRKQNSKLNITKLVSSYFNQFPINKQHLKWDNHIPLLAYLTALNTQFNIIITKVMIGTIRIPRNQRNFQTGFIIIICILSHFTTFIVIYCHF